MGTATATPKNDTRKDVYEIVNEKIIDQLENGIVPWHKPWTDAGVPTNLISRRPYRGINVMLLASLGYGKNFFITSKQLKEIGGSIYAEEKPHTIAFWSFPDKEHEAADTKAKPSLRYYSAYNLSQCAGLLPELVPEIPKVASPLTMCLAITKDMLQCPEIRHKEPNTFYDCLDDYINIPRQNKFESEEAYYAQLFHQLVHSTGHHTRLNRMGLVQMAEFGIEPFTQEELIAEIGTSYLQSFAGIATPFEPSKEYINGWLKKLRSDKYLIFNAASYAQKAVDFILNVQVEDVEQTEG
jgi:antirestriction protein ArdC